MPPSAMIGTLCRAAARAHSITDVIIGTPMPATTRVVQMEPAPMPTLTASTPASISASVASARRHVAGHEIGVGELAADARTMSMTFCEWPCAVSTTRTSTPADTRAAARSSESLAIPMAAAHAAGRGRLSTRWDT